jgi:hypothetical protein
MYTLYHILQRKEWGCTNDLDRRLNELNYSYEDLDRVITCGNIDMAANMERDLNIEYGYGWNISQDYRRVLSMAVNGGKKQGKIMFESGMLNVARLKSNEVRRSSKHSDETKMKIKSKAIGNNNKPTIAVLVFDKLNNLIGEYKSIISASNELNLHQGNICKVLKGELLTTGGYKIKYK